MLGSAIWTQFCPVVLKSGCAIESPGVQGMPAPQIPSKNNQLMRQGGLHLSRGLAMSQRGKGKVRVSENWKFGLRQVPQQRGRVVLTRTGQRSQHNSLRQAAKARQRSCAFLEALMDILKRIIKPLVQARIAWNSKIMLVNRLEYQVNMKSKLWGVQVVCVSELCQNTDSQNSSSKVPVQWNPRTFMFNRLHWESML